MTSVLSSRRAVAVGRRLQLLDEVRQQADVVAVDLGEVADAILARAVVRGDVEAGGDAALGNTRPRDVAAQLEGEHARDVGCEGQHLQVEHQLDVLVVRVGHADRRAGQLALLAAACCTPRPSGCGARSRGRRRGSRRGAPGRSCRPAPCSAADRRRAMTIEDAAVVAAALRRAPPGWRRRRTAGRTPRADRGSSAAASSASAQLIVSV